MARRVVVVLLGPVAWAPPGTDPATWQAALAEDVVDLVATLNHVAPAIAATAADRSLADAVAWPGMPVYELPPPTAGAAGRVVPTVGAAFAAAAADGYDQAAVVAADAPDVPGLILGKLLRPLTSRPVAVAPAEPDAARGLLGVAARLPAAEWLPDLDLDADAALIRAAAPRPGDVAVTPGWRRLRGPADLATLDPRVEGWDTTRALLGG
ncbi:hypothetical protein SAMN05444365_101259 [Micromonospora pattaloongensis]|uniref:MobA-like NTP transferase domain-containing protein n=1 Tax=Micromonospora pattaloongensis TaxID=405436 RepID=A0A1H3G2T3_9ACTN|nr:hypothetical protein [Micromonospora pattaloongensis]SDX97526.1 hypothetical protein SAMN05444365_101259 [Micromonospora pattaloongensis]